MAILPAKNILWRPWVALAFLYHWNFESFQERFLIWIFIEYLIENLMLFQNRFGLIVLSAFERTQKRHQSSLNFVAFLANCCKSILLNVCTKVKQSFINDCKQVHWYLLHCIATLICRNYCRLPVFTFEMAISMLSPVQNVGSKTWTTASGQSCSNKIMKIFKTYFFGKLF